ncbi:MAG: hypothetical protein V3T72_22035 [Thermoanaerobaculia bacterium]
MKNQHHAITLCVLTLVLVVVAGPAAIAQSLANDCGGTGNGGTTAFGNMDLAGAYVSPNRNPIANLLDTSACGGQNSSTDGVICITPTNSCSMTFLCTSTNGGATLEAKVATGACADPVASCVASGSSSAVVALTGGTEYCLYCESSTTGLLGFTLTESTDCGQLPVSLQGFSIGSSDIEESVENSDTESE